MNVVTTVYILSVVYYLIAITVRSYPVQADAIRKIQINSCHVTQNASAITKNYCVKLYNTVPPLTCSLLNHTFYTVLRKYSVQV